ncbi:hypothetical protein M011DRAFT_528787 [Sporormia fimetaria CBS 119925]|uniref:Uncharacterized protein n=1 Tax=Sporormia fimetaria CBS 119925 TaxID=1340428 RepID=A0A6A6UZX5_9PLEO|nr:hypothetical protein M011DRAFT_528787 [Sporormia fimetaria CBS 119925]
MAGFIQNILWNSVEGFVEAGKRSAGDYVGDALIKAGDMIEDGGRGLGGKIQRSASQYGEKISGKKYDGPSPSSMTGTKKAVTTRSRSMPAAIGTRKAITAGTKTTKALPTTATKQITNGPARKQLTNGTAKKSATAAVSKGLVPPQSTGPRAVKKTPATANKNIPKPYPNNVPYGASKTPSNVGGYKAPGTPNAYPTSKKTAVKPGRPQPFAVKNETAAPEKKAYPGQGSRTPVKPQRYGPTADRGKVQHIPLGGIGKGTGAPSNKSAGMGGKGGGGHIPIGNLGMSSGASTAGSVKPSGGQMQHIAGF